MVTYASRPARAAHHSGAEDEAQKKIEKILKKCLTKQTRCGMIIPAAEDEWRAPCKLNNETNTKHQKEWLFQRALKEACLDNVN